MKHFIWLSLVSILLISGCGSTAQDKNGQQNSNNLQAKKFVAEVISGAQLYPVNKDSKGSGKKQQFGIDWHDIKSLPVNSGAWLAVDQVGKLDNKTDWKIVDNILTRASKNKFGRGLSFVINNNDGLLTGEYPFSFEYFLKDADISTPEVHSMMAYRVTGIPNNDWQGQINLTAGNGAFAGSGATASKVQGSVDLKSKGKLALTSTWLKEEAKIDVTGMKWIVISFGVSSREDTSQDLSEVVGIRNVMVPSP
ncbi:hypothetical protein [Catenovulum maritimum]|uniref:Lipoprotein n=1 Tax=Catenovulum maritimum TaxID=1513271 RepID=A0A0J8JP07_9ALTE|nr:hypothetical protein [Catenovulum maritimum]KMT66376.1 hypothetical protein XM47_03865 [Catenovulum maritimum]